MKLFDRDDYRYSFFDGMCAHIYGTLTGGVFLTGFALYLEMNEFLLGLMMAVPFIVTLIQLPASYYICRKGFRKRVAFRTATLARLTWLPIVAVGLMPFLESTTRCLLVLSLFLVLQAFSSVSYIAWISWTSDLVPDEIRGKFFGTRNMLCGAAGIFTVLIFGNLMDALKADWGPTALVFAVPFGSAVVFGLLSSHFLNRIKDVPAPAFCGGGFFKELSTPFKDANFRRFLLFALCWNFSVYLAAPFLSLYFLRDLQYSYGFVALLATTAAVVDVFAMKFWGAVSDRIKNKAIIQTAGWGVVFLPALWAFVRPQDVFVPVAIQMLSGGFWAAVVLCSGNLLLRISPQQGREWFISAYSISAGLGAAMAPVIGGVVLSILSQQGLEEGMGIMPLHVLFIASAAFRMLSLLLFRFVREPQENSLRQSVQILFGSNLRAPMSSDPKTISSSLFRDIWHMARRAGTVILRVIRPVARRQM